MTTAFEDYVNRELPRRPALLTVAITGYDGDPNSVSAPSILKSAPTGTWYLQETPTRIYFRKINAGPTDWTAAEHSDYNKEVFISLAGQTVFTLLAVAFDPDTYTLTINGVEYVRGSDYTVSGTTLTWLGTFTLALGDRIVVTYQL